MQEIVATGSTVDEAVDTACAQLGLSRDDVTYEIVEMPQKKLFGMSPARVLVKPIDDGFSISDLLSGNETSNEEKTETPKNKPQQKYQERRPKEYDADPVSATPETEVPIDGISAPAKAALEYLKEVAAKMGATQLEYKAYQTDRGIKFAIDGEDSAIVIGRRGETMESLQYLCMLVSSRTEGDYCKIILDVANYRSKREKTLQSLARREADKVKKTLYNQTLEPMNPYERRIVHSAIQDIEGVKSESVGSEPNRRVVISMISGGKGSRSRRGPSHGGGKGGNSRGGRPNNRGRGGYKNSNDKPGSSTPRPAQTADSAPAKTTESADASKLYGKIDF